MQRPVVDYAGFQFDGPKPMRDVPVQMSDPRRKPPSKADSGVVISVERSSGPRAAPSPPPPPVWGGIDRAPPPTRDFRGPFLFIAALIGVALTAFGLLAYAIYMETAPQLETFEVDGAAASNGGDEGAEGATASIWLDGAPYGATVRVNADSVGVLPMTIENLPSGEHLLTIEAENQSLDTLVAVTAGKMSAVFLRLGASDDLSGARVDVEADARAAETAVLDTPQGSGAVDAGVPSASQTGLLRIVTEPAGAVISLDGVPVGTSPLVLPEVEARTHVVSASMDGREPTDATVGVVGGSDQMVRLSLVPVAGPGALQVLVQPWGTIYIDGVLHKRNTDVVYRTELPSGAHEIRVEHPTFGTRTRQVTIQAGESLREVFDLTTGTTSSGS
ncbi:MAG: PEGA domain-containing protein [Bacteroidota bacterium]